MFDLAKLYISHFTNMSGQQFYAKGPVDDLVTAYEGKLQDLDNTLKRERAKSQKLLVTLKRALAWARDKHELPHYSEMLYDAEQSIAEYAKDTPVYHNKSEMRRIETMKAASTPVGSPKFDRKAAIERAEEMWSFPNPEQNIIGILADMAQWQFEQLRSHTEAGEK